MGNRLTTIYTRTGDDGTTGLGDGSRTEKDSLRVCAMGEVDHLNAFIGSILCHPDVPPALAAGLADVQHDLFDLGAELCMPYRRSFASNRVVWLETQIDAMNLHLGRLKDFILPGGTVAASQAHLARTACRNAERAVLALYREDPTINEALRQYLNRLSDYLFVAARELNRSAGRQDVQWIQRKTEACAQRVS